METKSAKIKRRDERSSSNAGGQQLQEQFAREKAEEVRRSIVLQVGKVSPEFSRNHATSSVQVRFGIADAAR